MLNGSISLSQLLAIGGSSVEDQWCLSGADPGGGCRGCAPPPPEMTFGFLIQLVFCKKKKLCGLLVLK